MLKYHTSLLAKCHFYWLVSGWTAANTSPALAIVSITSMAFWWGLRWYGRKWPEQLHSQLYTQTTCTTIPMHHFWNDGLWNFIMGFQVYWLRNLPQLFLVSKRTAFFLGKTHGRQMDLEKKIPPVRCKRRCYQKKKRKKKHTYTDYFTEFSIIPSHFEEGNHSVWSQVIRFLGKELSEDWSVVWLWGLKHWVLLILVCNLQSDCDNNTAEVYLQAVFQNSKTQKTC